MNTPTTILIIIAATMIFSAWFFSAHGEGTPNLFDNLFEEKPKSAIDALLEQEPSAQRVEERKPAPIIEKKNERLLNQPGNFLASLVAYSIIGFFIAIIAWLLDKRVLPRVLSRIAAIATGILRSPQSAIFTLGIVFALLAGFSIFYYFFLRPYQNDRPYRECLNRIDPNATFEDVDYEYRYCVKYFR